MNIGSGPGAPLALDLFCGAGGVSQGLVRAGFKVLGVDLVRQPNYPFDFLRADALTVASELDLWCFDFIWASPPCQQYSVTRSIWGNKYPDLVGPVRGILQDSGTLFCIENVPGAPLQSPVMLCGAMFINLGVYRHRHFETNFKLPQPFHPQHKARTTAPGYRRLPGEFMSIAGHIASVDEARRAMGIDWMNRDELAEAIPPAYAEYIGHWARRALGHQVKLARRAVPRGMEETVGA